MLSVKKQESLMRAVLKEVEKAKEKGDNPFAAILVDSKGNIIEKAHNSQNSKSDRTAHAEVVLIRKACNKLGKNYYLNGYSVIQNSEPCSMCMSLLVKAKINTVYFGAKMDMGNDPLISAKEIAERSKHKINVVGGILEKECQKSITEVRNSKFYF